MAGEEAVLRDGDVRRWSGPWALDAVHSALPIGLTVLFFLLAFFVYYFSQPSPTPYNVPVRLADAMLRGRLDIANAEELGLTSFLEFAPYHGKYFATDPPGASLLLLPAVLLFGVGLSQAMVSFVIGGITASTIYRLMRGLTEKLSVQVWLTLLFVFGTIFWWVTATGDSWEFNTAVAVLFLFLAIYATLVSKRPFWAGLFLGAAYFTRLSIILGLPFFVIMFSDQWLPESSGKSLLRRIDFKPLLLLASGLGIFLLLSFIYNYLAFETPLPASYHHYNSQAPEPRTIFAASNISSIHLPVFFKSLPYFQAAPPYVVPSLAGVAIWVTTPVFLYALFAGIRNKVALAVGLAVLVVTLTIFVLSNRAGIALLGIGNPLRGIPFGLEYYPILLLIGYGLFVAIRDGNRLVIACWAAIIPIALLLFSTRTFPFQFGYRYALDFYPFLFLLTWAAIGDKIKWHHMLLITIAIMINLWGVLWTIQFDSHQFLGLDWARI